MNRPIKFRAVFEGKLIYFDLLDIYNNAIAFDKSIIETIQQFTDLLDKNKREIFEGDILRKTNKFLGKTYTHLSVVEFDDGAFVGRDLERNNLVEVKHHLKVHYEVVGNIYEDSELLGA